MVSETKEIVESQGKKRRQQLSLTSVLGQWPVNDALKLDHIWSSCVRLAALRRVAAGADDWQALVPLALAEVHFLYWKLGGKQIN